MYTFDEFLRQFNEEVEETFEEAEMTPNAKEAVVSVMKQYLANRKFDPLQLMELFENACYHAMGKKRVSNKELLDMVRRQAKDYLTEEPDYTNFPDITFEEVEERRAIGR